MAAAARPSTNEVGDRHGRRWVCCYEPGLCSVRACSVGMAGTCTTTGCRDRMEACRVSSKARAAFGEDDESFRSFDAFGAGTTLFGSAAGTVG